MYISCIVLSGLSVFALSYVFGWPYVIGFSLMLGYSDDLLKATFWPFWMLEVGQDLRRIVRE